jgi:anti-sigma-K factor RskA
MRDLTDANRAARDDIALQAILYAGGLLDADEAAAFEGLLATDQNARDALARAACDLFAGRRGTVRPGAGYRKRVRRRLRRRAAASVDRAARSNVRWRLAAAGTVAAAVVFVLIGSYVSVPLQHRRTGVEMLPVMKQPAGPPRAVHVVAPMPLGETAMHFDPGAAVPGAGGSAEDAPNHRRFVVIDLTN